MIAALIVGFVYAIRLAAVRYRHAIAAVADRYLAPPSAGRSPDPQPTVLPTTGYSKARAPSRKSLLGVIAPEPEPPAQSSPPMPKKPRLVPVQHWPSNDGRRSFGRFDQIASRGADTAPAPSREPASRTDAKAAVRPGQPEEEAPEAEIAGARTRVFGGGLSQRQVDEFSSEHIDQERAARLRQTYSEKAERERWTWTLLSNIGIVVSAFSLVVIVLLAGLWRDFRRT